MSRFLKPGTLLASLCSASLVIAGPAAMAQNAPIQATQLPPLQQQWKQQGAPPLQQQPPLLQPAPLQQAPPLQRQQSQSVTQGTGSPQPYPPQPYPAAQPYLTQAPPAQALPRTPATQSPARQTPVPQTSAPQTSASLMSAAQAPPLFAQPPVATPPATVERPNVWLPATTAKLQALDKINAQAISLTIKVGDSASFDSLTITVKACVIRPPDQPADAAAYVDVTDSHADQPGFDGWMLEDEPAVSMMQHPVYDLRISGCA